jgi:hypothetical protein
LGGIVEYFFMGVDEIVEEVVDVGLFCTCFCSDEYFVIISNVLLEFLYEGFLVKKAVSHVFVCLKNHQSWAVNESMENVFLYKTDVGEGFSLKICVLLCYSCCELIGSCFDGATG